MKLQDVILKALAKKITWIEAAEIAGMSVRNMQRMRQGYQASGYTGLFDRRRGKNNYHRVPLETAEKVLALYQEKYFDLSVQHFHKKLQAEHNIRLSYSWIKQALQGAGLVTRRKKRGPHRTWPPRRPMAGILLHIDCSKHRCFQDDRYYDLIVILDDATSEIYYAQLVEEESTRTVMSALREVIEQKGLFCTLYSDRGSHFFVTPREGEKVDKTRLTQIGRALKELGVQMIPAYSPRARGRMGHSYSTWQGRLPQQLRLAQITTLAEANAFLRQRYIAEFNSHFKVKAAERATAFRPCTRRDLDWVFSIQTERVVSKDNTVAIRGRWWQIEKCRWRYSLVGQTVTIHEHLDASISIRFGPHIVAHFPANPDPEGRGKDGAVESAENQGKVSHPSHRPLENSQNRRISHFSAASPMSPLALNAKAQRIHETQTG